MSATQVVVLGGNDDRTDALAAAFDRTVHRAANPADAADAATEAVVVVCDGRADWREVVELVGASARVFVLTSGEPTPAVVAEHGATPIHDDDDWDWTATVAAELDTNSDVRVAADESDHFDKLVENAPVPIAVIGPEYTVLRVNDAAADILGYETTDAIEGVNVSEFVHEDNADAAHERLDSVIEGRSVAPPMEMSLRAADGGRVRVLAATSPARVDGVPAARAILPLDEPYETRRELADSREKIEAIHDVAVELETAETTEAVCERTVAAAEEILEFDICVIDSVRDGYFHVEAASEHLPDENVAQSPIEEGGLLGESYRTGETIITHDIAESEIADPQGPYSSALSVPVGTWGAFQAASTESGGFDADDAELAEILLSHASVALERIERERELQRRERAFSALHDATREMAAAKTQDAVVDRAVAAARNTLDIPLSSAYTYEADGDYLRPVTATDEAAATFGEVPELHPGESIAYTAYEDRDVVIHDDLAESDATPRIDGIRSLMVLPLGDFGVLALGSTEPNAFGAVDISAGRVLAANTRTVLERVDRERELIEQRERLDEFASIVAHDLRNPLNHASGFLELARETDDASHLDRVDANLSRMDDLIQDVLTLARQGNVIGDTEPVDLATAARDAWRTASDGDGTLSVAGDVTVSADRERLVELLGNLFENARMHGGDTVTVGTLDDGFFVADDGPGIPEDSRDDVFDHGYSTNSEGTGFGLNIVASIADAHGWTVDVTEGDAGGARFEFRNVTASEA